MGIGRRLLDLARANLNALLDRAGGANGEVAKATDKDLEEELARRRERRLREDAERAQRIEAERQARQRAEERAASGAAARKPPPRSNGANGSNGARAKTPPPRAPKNAEEKRLRELHAQLEVPFGASFDEVKKSFRRLMRKYHPDLHLSDAKKHRAATQLTMTLTQAYRELERHFEKR